MTPITDESNRKGHCRQMAYFDSRAAMNILIDSTIMTKEGAPPKIPNKATGASVVASRSQAETEVA